MQRKGEGTAGLSKGQVDVQCMAAPLNNLTKSYEMILTMMAKMTAKAVPTP